MEKEDTYKSIDCDSSVAEEPVAAYGRMEALRSRIVKAVNEMDDEDRLMECLQVLHVDTMPCVYTDEEFEKVLEESERRGYVTHEDALRYFAQWGIVE